MARTPTDRRDLPAYTLSEAAWWLGQKPGRLRSWLVGQTSAGSEDGRTRMRPVIKPADTDPVMLSFWNLVECSVLATTRDQHGVSLQKIRRALDYVSRKLRTPRPLIEQEFLTDGVDLFIDRLGSLVSASEGGQTAMREVLEASLERIERDSDGLARRLFPWRSDPAEPRTISVDPGVAFGRPVVSQTRVPVETIFERFRAGDSLGHLAKEYELDPRLIEDVVRKWFGAAA